MKQTTIQGNLNCHWNIIWLSNIEIKTVVLTVRHINLLKCFLVSKCAPKYFYLIMVFIKPAFVCKSLNYSVFYNFVRKCT